MSVVTCVHRMMEIQAAVVATFLRSVPSDLAIRICHPALGVVTRTRVTDASEGQVPATPSTVKPPLWAMTRAGTDAVQ